MTTEAENIIAAAIENAEEICDPLDDLMDDAAADPAAPFAPEVLARLAGLKRQDRAGFEALRARLADRSSRHCT